MNKGKSNIKSRGQKFTQRPTTKIWHEQPIENNPYIASSARCYGYDLTQLMQHKSYSDVIFLLFKGELPNRDQAKLFEKLFISMINPGPRHPATRAGMVAGVSKTCPTHLLPISLSVFSGNHLGAAGVDDCMRFLKKHTKFSPDILLEDFKHSLNRAPTQDDFHPVPGFGSYFGGIDILASNIASQLADFSGSGSNLQWGMKFSELLRPFNLGWLMPGVVSACLNDLKFNPKFGPGLFQLMSAPGLLAHSMEMINRPITAMPFPGDEDYFIEPE